MGHKGGENIVAGMFLLKRMESIAAAAVTSGFIKGKKGGGKGKKTLCRRDCDCLQLLY